MTDLLRFVEGFPLLESGITFLRVVRHCLSTGTAGACPGPASCCSLLTLASTATALLMPAPHSRLLPCRLP